MMNKQIRRMIDEIFADMKMTADNLALRDELMANAQARFEDSVRAGKTEEEAFAEVAASLGDVQSLLREMNAEKPRTVRNKPPKPRLRRKATRRPRARKPGPTSRILRSRPKRRRISAKRWARLSARWATWASRLCRRRRSWFGRWTT